LDPNYIKALHRRANARTALGKLSEAKADLERVLQSLPGNTLVSPPCNTLQHSAAKRTHHISLRCFLIDTTMRVQVEEELRKVELRLSKA
jgi:hypothetical protein